MSEKITLDNDNQDGKNIEQIPQDIDVDSLTEESRRNIATLIKLNRKSLGKKMSSSNSSNMSRVMRERFGMVDIENSIFSGVINELKSDGVAFPKDRTSSAASQESFSPENNEGVKKLEEFLNKKGVGNASAKAAMVFLSKLTGERVSSYNFTEEIESPKYNNFYSGQLLPENTITGKILSHLGCEPKDYLYEIDEESVSIDYKSYTRIKMFAKIEAIIAGLVEYAKETGDEKLVYIQNQKILECVRAEKLQQVEEAENVKARKKEVEDSIRKKIEEGTGGVDVSPKTMEVIKNNLSSWKGDLKVLDPNTVVVWEERHSYSGSSGVAMYSDVSVYRNGVKQTQSFQFRDAFSASRDNWDNRITEISGAKIVEKKGVVSVVLTTDKGRKLNFEFEKDIELPETKTLLKKEQEKFKSDFRSRINKIIEEYNKWWESTPILATPTGKTRYQRPLVKNQIFKPEHGVGVVQIERQIDHRSRFDNPQMMSELFVMTAGSEMIRFAEGHGYKTEQKGVVSLLGINPLDKSIDYSIDGKVGTYKY